MIMRKIILTLMLLSSTVYGEPSAYPKFKYNDKVVVTCNNHLSDAAVFFKCDTFKIFEVIDFFYARCTKRSTATCYSYVLRPLLNPASSCKSFTAVEGCLGVANDAD